jgi:hypothetical protein
VLSAAEDRAEAEEEEEEEAEAVREDSGTRTGAIAQGAIRRVAAHHLGGAEARAMTAEVRVEARHQEGESVITVLLEAELVEGDAARAIQMPATGVEAVIAAVAETAADAGDSAV